MLSENKQKKSNARAAILANIRQKLAASAPFDAARGAHQAHQSPTADLPLTAEKELQKVSLVERFRENLISIGGNCAVVANEREAARVVGEIIQKTNACGIAISDSQLVKSVCEKVKTKSVFIEKVAAGELFEFDLGITSAQWAIAETGTLVLESSREFHRLTSLVPPVHVAIIKQSCLRETLGEVLEILNREDLSPTITFITGPSRTSDIELQLAIGVHGPAELYVVIIAD